MKKQISTFRHAITRLLAASALALSGATAVFGQDASATYKGTGRDPFVKYRPPVKRKVMKKEAAPVTPPSIQERISGYKAHKAAAINAQMPAPKPTTALLISEVQVTGIFRTPRGYAAMVEASPIKLSYVIYPGETFFDGQLVAIEEDRLVFRHETRWTDGRRVMDVQTRPLRQPNAVENAMTNNKTASASSPSSEASDRKDATSSAVKKELKTASSGNR